MPPRVSVLVKSYNHRRYVGRCIQSVLDQSFQDFEIVVTDDASNDGTADVIRQFTDPRIRLEVSSRNEGISLAMNRTIARARGELFAILNSDDFALPGRLQRQVAFLDQNPSASALFTVPKMVGENGEDLPSEWPRRPKGLRNNSPEALLRHFFFHSNFLCAPSAMIRRSAYTAAGEYDPRLTNLQDFDMWIRMAAAGIRFQVLNETLTAFRVRDENRNMSAPRRDTLLRARFEYSRILNRYRALSADAIKAIFAEDIAEQGLPGDLPASVLLASLALTRDSHPHRLFALETLYETARDIDDFDRLREATGRIDVFGERAKRRILAKPLRALARTARAVLFR